MTVLVTGGAGYIGSHMVWELLDAGENVVVLDRLSTGFEWAVAPEAKLVVGDVADKELVGVGHPRHACRCDHPFCRLDRGAGIGRRPARLLREQHLQDAIADRDRGRESVTQFHLFLDRRRLWRRRARAGARGCAALQPESPYGVSKLMTRMDAARRRRQPTVSATRRCATSTSPAPIRRGRTGQSTPGATHLIKVACETALGKRPYMQVFGTDYPTPDGTCMRDYIHVSDLVAAHRLALAAAARRGRSMVANCGYGHGYSVLEVIDSVRRVHGADFDVRIGARRPGDAPAVVANSDLARRELGWTPKHDDLDQIVADALNWERQLSRKNVAHGIQTPETGNGLSMPKKNTRARS